MSLLLISALAVAGSVQAACSWDRPNVNPFMGDVVTAVDRYQDIPADVRGRLKQRIASRRYDDLASIKRDSIVGAYHYADLRDMHFGKGSVCRTVSRERWPEKTEERGLVYCEEGHCLIVPTVCRNVSRVTRVPHKQAQADTPAGPPERLDVPFAGAPQPGELQFEAPSAGATPSFASLVQDTPMVPVGVSRVASAGLPSPAPRGEVADTSWSGFAGLPTPVPLPIFVAGGPPSSALRPPPVLDTGFPAVPGVLPPPSTPPVPTTTPTVPPVIVEIPTVPPMVEPPTPPSGPGPAPVVTPPNPVVPTSPPVPEVPVPGVPNVPGVPEVPSTPTGPGVPGVPAVPPSPTVPPSEPGSGLNPNPDAPVPAAPIPEPTTLGLMALGLALVGWMSRRSIRRSSDEG